MGQPPGEPPEPDDDERRQRDRDTEPIPRVRPDDGLGRPDGPDGPSFPDDGGYPTGSGYPGEDRSGRAWVREPETAYQPPQFTEDELAGLRVDASGLPSGPRRVLPLEDEPSSLVARYLFPTERYRGEWKRHWIHLATPLLVGIAATFVLGYLSGFLAGQDVGALTTVAVLAWFVVMGWVAWKVADWWYDRFILTNKRVMVVNGIITRKVAMMPLARVTDMKYEQSPTGRALNYGTFVLESAGQDQALREIKNLPNPNELYLRVVEEMYEPQAVEARLGKEADEAKADDGA
ncbi:PH domain-containing protein [Micromonospora echinofusca]|uniref:PH domain-containing protein n=1 Tax=Micromonospora echinofusca TaxID=47858 RepID=A0ABS3VS72_MICEH|nr:PH domain-containing protein [Micromonospora echinofusca]MBO4207387.1 PH domain-containing protein [Micromonospora echinofusca]